MVSSRGQCKKYWLSLPLPGSDLWCDCKASNTNTFQLFSPFRSLPMGYFVCLLLEVCHWHDKQCSTEGEALETQKLKMENSSVKDQLAHRAW